MNAVQTLGRKAGTFLSLFATAMVLGLTFMEPAAAVFTVPTEITDAATNVGLVGAAVFAIMVGIKLYKWLKRAL